jgi:uncharacterized membrane-anchored protein YitT (DUF2179 family)
MIISKNLKSSLKEYSLSILGLFFFVFAWTGFLIPHQIAGGGVSGLSSMIYYATGIPVSYAYFVINVVLLIIGFMVLGKKFGVKTIFCILLSSLFFEIFPKFLWTSNINDTLLNSLIGGAMGGLGISIVLLQGGSTGGIDIIVMIINKYRKISPGRLYLIFDVMIISSYLLLPDKSFADIVYGFVVMVVFTYTVDLVMTGRQASVQVMIFSKKNEEIADEIFDKLDRGVSIVNTKGWYTKNENNALLVIVRKNELYLLKKILKECDPTTFYSITPTTAVYGTGFDIEKKSIDK